MTDETENPYGQTDLLYFVFAVGVGYSPSGAWRSETTATALARARFRKDGVERLVLGVPVAYLALINGDGEPRTLRGRNRPGRPPGSRKLSDEQVAGAARALGKGARAADVAAGLGVSESTLRRAVLGVGPYRAVAGEDSSGGD